jgi:hypothetical protein
MEDFKLPLIEETSNKTIIIAAISAAILILIVVIYMLRRQKSDGPSDPKMAERMAYLDNMMEWDRRRREHLKNLENTKIEPPPTEEIQHPINERPSQVPETINQTIVQPTSSGSENTGGVVGDK